MPTFDPAAHADTAKSPVRSAQAADASPTLVELSIALQEQLETVTDQATTRILTSIGGYRPGSEVPRDDLWWSVHRNVEVVANALATREAPASQDLEARKELGVRRARQGLPLPDLMRAFRVGYLEVWDVLLTLARERGGDAVAALASDAALVWNTMDLVSSAVESGYRDEIAATGMDHRRRSQALLDALRAGQVPQARALLKEMGNDPDDRFGAAAFDGIHPDPGGTTDVLVDLVDHGILIQPVAAGSPAWIASATHVGLSVAGAPVEELGRCVAEAERALGLARILDEAVVDHDERWFECLVVEQEASLPRRVMLAADALVDDDEMATTIAACLDHDGNVSRAAKAVHLHPNGVSYRLARFAEQHGIDPRTSEGAADARAALTMARARTSRG